ncbi:hypothetical protein DSO57_1005029 [Entomophthora muscae]|uniref:Uncharacterized protein n=1 Tax=Entomophthora muscae TaxID=34485 RepID=A0ACC2TJB8_9FUNG|nr:hypothetical protein DSO57_1005029 [Entomophthora muscae]
MAFQAQPASPVGFQTDISMGHNTPPLTPAPLPSPQVSPWAIQFPAPPLSHKFDHDFVPMGLL